MYGWIPVFFSMFFIYSTICEARLIGKIILGLIFIGLVAAPYLIEGTVIAYGSRILLLVISLGCYFHGKWHGYTSG